MSRIIKASVWEDEPCVVEVPLADASLFFDDDEEDFGQRESRRGKGQPVTAAELLQGQKALEEAKADFENTREAMLMDLLHKKKEADALLEQARRDGELLRVEAETERQNIIEDAHRQADSLREEAKAAGHEEGIAAGREEGIQQIRDEEQQILLDANAHAEKTMRDAKEAAHAYVLQAEDEIASIAMEIADKVLPQHFIDVPQIILPLIRKALLKVKDQPEVIVRVSSGDYDLVLLARSEFQAMLEGSSAVLEVRSDEHLEPGSCVLETPNGNVDARVATQLAMIRQAIQDAMS
ncbi:MAG: FliH/SctL family protein [Schwartzia sp. (in: firmicutes)]